MLQHLVSYMYSLVLFLMQAKVCYLYEEYMEVVQGTSEVMQKIENANSNLSTSQMQRFPNLQLKFASVIAVTY
jgi:hypothetical protein